MSNSCPCTPSPETPLVSRQEMHGGSLSADYSDDYPENLLPSGTVLDGTTGVRGIVASVDPKEHTITVDARTLDGYQSTVILEEGYPGIFDDISVDDSVYCVVVIRQAPVPSGIRGTCYWLIDFSTRSGPVQEFIANETENGTVRVVTAAAAESAAAFIDSAVSNDVDSQSPVCVVAAVKALGSATFQEKASELIWAGYFPVGFECWSGAAESTLSGYINVAFEFRNTHGHARVVVVPVKLSTWAAAAGLKVETGDIREVRAESLQVLGTTCASVTIRNGKACLRVPYAGSICISVPSWVPNGTVAEACARVCKKWGIPCGVKVWINALGHEVAGQKWGCC